MKTIMIISGIIILFMSLFTGCPGQDDFPVVKGDYLGQKPPGDTPEVFAPGIISTEATEGASSFSNDGCFYFFARARSAQEGIFIMEQKNGIWSKPRLAPFSAGQYDWDFMLAPDGKTVLVASGRPISEGAPPLKDHQIWVSERTDGIWSNPQLLPFPVNSGQHDSYPSLTEDGTLYFFSRRDGGSGHGDIYRSRKMNDRYPEIENLREPVNTVHHEVDPYIAPDESYLIFCSDKLGGFGNEDFYISYRKNDGSWTIPVNMGDKVNSPHQEYIPYVTPDGKYFFFTSDKSGNRDIYWMDAKIIEELKPGELK
ncbi:MAG: PD40 domain-containing protein [Candidatus Aminicenantes bacterium]|nr:MAG: PD40 domain-containing protein [Candidatus Aminicenantes bacterium]